MNALGNLHLDAAIPVTVAAMSLKVIRVSHKTPFMLRRGYEDLSGALRCSSVCSSVLSCALSCALLFALLRSCSLLCDLLRSCVLSPAVLCAPARSCALSCGPVRSPAVLCASLCFPALLCAPVCSPVLLCSLLCSRCDFLPSGDLVLLSGLLCFSRYCMLLYASTEIHIAVSVPGHLLAERVF